jgi:hypothetical protein
MKQRMYGNITNLGPIRQQNIKFPLSQKHRSELFGMAGFGRSFNYLLGQH